MFSPGGFLASLGIEPGDRASVLAPNTHVALETHLGVPAGGAVLNALNTRLSVAELVYIVNYAGSELLICDRSLADVGASVVERLGSSVRLVDCGASDLGYELG
jgi:acyl-CoA synthetase (AMP-forming)/AMP-acid ligase II